MTAALLREAAQLMRQRANDATPGRWWVHRDEAEVVWYGDEAETYRLDENPDSPASEWDSWARTTGQLSYGELREAADAAHIAAWDPLVARVVADWLDVTAEDVGTSSLAFHAAVAVARAYLGSPT